MILEFMNESDNIRAIRGIKSLIMSPMVNQDNEVMGLFQLYNYKYGSLTMNTIKKMKAISKFLGGCSDMVSLSAENLLVKVGLNSRME